MINNCNEKEHIWINEFIGKYKRKPRILYIGNIANNAYINAKILNRSGVECDVMCYDYYHIMGCPEWEDSDFKGKVDDFKPDWSSVNLNGFKRPLWFVQGPSRFCIAYLVARRDKKLFKSFIWKMVLKNNNLFEIINKHTRLKSNLKLMVNGFPKTFESIRAKTLTFIKSPGEMGKIQVVKHKLLNARARLVPIKAKLFKLHHWRFPLGAAVFYLIASIASPLLSLTCFLLLILSGVFYFIYKALRVFKRILVRISKPLRAAYRALKWEANNAGLESVLTDENSVGFKDINTEKIWVFEEKANELIAKYESVFPDREDKLSMNDMGMYQSVIYSWRELFRRYDLIHGYATDGIWPMLSNKPYVAYEHGTIRNIPFQNDILGRLCALSYRLADRVCITNADNINAAKKLGLDNYGFIPHPINEDFMKDDSKTIKLKKELHEALDSDFIVFHPSRQHWEEKRHPDWEKGNDIFIKGFARFVKEVNPKAGAIFVDWGVKVPESKALLEELGVGDRVMWISPLPNRKMIRYIRATEMLADQFYLGAFGSTMPKALACKKPAMLYLNTELHEWCFSEMPPVLNTKTEDEVFDSLAKLYKDKQWRNELCTKGKAWYDKYHSNQVIKDVLLDNYEEVLRKNDII